VTRPRPRKRPVSRHTSLLIPTQEGTSCALITLIRVRIETKDRKCILSQIC